MHIETEAKFEVKRDDLESVRRQLIELGASAFAGPHTEENELYDFPDARLARSGCALRLRAYGNQNLLTFKGPIQSDPLLKRREEIETDVQQAQAVKTILSRLGLAVSFGYRKTREILRIEQGEHTLQVCLDETPVGCFVEVEGDAAGIKQLAARFGWTEFITKSYVDLYLERRR
ncbi:MAG: CYTH domain-containing protein [Acidobacteria bacterium]|nr:MAG: CYTH domain-containing protein [Acidobacteriota bacterium]